MEFLSPRLSYIFVNRTTKYCCHVWTDAPNCYLNMLDKLQKLVRMVVGPTLAASPVSLTHQRNVVSLSLFYRYYIRKSSFELAELEPYRSFMGRLLNTLIDCTILHLCHQFISSVGFTMELFSCGLIYFGIWSESSSFLCTFLF